MQRLYTIFIWILGSASWVMQYFSVRHRKWWNGRRDQVIRNRKGARPIWIHCASLGEFEQGRPLIEALKQQWPEIPIVLTFFSPSGYEIRANYEQADEVYYLPIDLPRHVSAFIDRIDPRLAIFVKYEFWFNYLRYLHQKKVPTIFVSVLIKANHHLLSWPWRPLVKEIKRTNQIFVQDRASAQMLSQHGFNNVKVAGDTRVDRVVQIRKKPKSFGWIDELAEQKRTIVYGSIWPSDLMHLRSFISARQDGQYLHIVAPHRLDRDFIDDIAALSSGGAGFLSKSDNAEDVKLLIVDTMGDLAHLYQWAWLSYVGGGFGEGIHSILEPAAFHRPVIFGPKHGHFHEAQQLIDQQVAIEIHGASDFERAIEHFSDPEAYDLAITRCAAFFALHQGATSKIVHYLSTQNWLT